MFFLSCWALEYFPRILNLFLCLYPTFFVIHKLILDHVKSWKLYLVISQLFQILKEWIISWSMEICQVSNRTRSYLFWFQKLLLQAFKRRYILDGLQHLQLHLLRLLKCVDQLTTLLRDHRTFNHHLLVLDEHVRKDHQEFCYPDLKVVETWLYY